MQDLRAEIEKLKAEKEDAEIELWAKESKYDQEKQNLEHDLQLEIDRMKGDVDQLYNLVAALTKDKIKIDIDAPLTKTEKKAMKNDDW